MREVVVLGIGNKLMMDDGIGVYVVEELKKRNPNKFICFINGETDIYYCLNQIKDSSYLIIIDAAYHGNKPGAVCSNSIKEVLKNISHPISIHESHLINEIKMTGISLEGALISIEPFEVNYFFGLSTVLTEQFVDIVCEVEKIIENLLNFDTQDM